MTLTNRQRGDYFERQVKATLEALGWVVYRSAGSHGAADLIAMRADKTTALIQCKISGRIDPTERAALLAEAERGGCRALVAMRPRGGRVLMLRLIPGAARLVPDDVELQIPPAQHRAARADEIRRAGAHS